MMFSLNRSSLSSSPCLCVFVKSLVREPDPPDKREKYDKSAARFKIITSDRKSHETLMCGNNQTRPTSASTERVEFINPSVLQEKNGERQGS